MKNLSGRRIWSGSVQAYILDTGCLGVVASTIDDSNPLARSPEVMHMLSRSSLANYVDCGVTLGTTRLLVSGSAFQVRGAWIMRSDIQLHILRCIEDAANSMQRRSQWSVRVVAPHRLRRLDPAPYLNYALY